MNNRKQEYKETSTFSLTTSELRGIEYMSYKYGLDKSEALGNIIRAVVRIESAKSQGICNSSTAILDELFPEHSVGLPDISDLL